MKRYRGGLASDVIVFDLKKTILQKHTKTDATEGKPACTKTKFTLFRMPEKSSQEYWSYDNSIRPKPRSPILMMLISTTCLRSDDWCSKQVEDYIF